MEQKLVSVVMPVYNASKFLDEAVRSVLNQTYRNFELIMIDDCSKDNSLEIARNYAKQDERIRVRMRRFVKTAHLVVLLLQWHRAFWLKVVLLLELRLRNR